jgi:ActR/RegA family two-component response regulator
MKTKAVLSDTSGIETKMFQTSTTIHPEEKAPLTFSKKKIMPKTKSTTKEILLFIVDDDAMYLKALEQSISVKLPLIKIKTFLTGEACLQQMKLKPDVVILDYFLDSKVSYAWNGLTILKQIKKLNPKTKVIMLSAQDSLDVAVKCIDNGSFDYISKSESAFVKINNVLTNIMEDIKTSDKGLRPYQIIGIIAIVILILSYILIKK